MSASHLLFLLWQWKETGTLWYIANISRTCYSKVRITIPENWACFGSKLSVWNEIISIWKRSIPTVSPPGLFLWENCLAEVPHSAICHWVCVHPSSPLTWNLKRILWLLQRKQTKDLWFYWSHFSYFCTCFHYLWRTVQTQSAQRYSILCIS